MSVGHLDVFFGKVSLHVFCPFLHRIFCVLGVEFDKILDTDPLSDMSFANIFSYSISCLLVGCFLCSAEAFYLDEVPVVHFAFVSLDLAVVS